MWVSLEKDVPCCIDALEEQMREYETLVIKFITLIALGRRVKISHIGELTSHIPHAECNTFIIHFCIFPIGAVRCG